MVAADSAQAALNFAGANFSPGSTVQANVPLSAQAKSYAGQGGNPVPPSAVAVLATPANFDPRKSWPVLIICSTSDFKRQNRDDLVQFYRTVGLAEGWVLVAGDGPQRARADTAGWGTGTTPPALAALHRRFSRAGKRPSGCGRFPGRGKRAGSHAPVPAPKRLSPPRSYL